jgi:hypothetical protein
VVGLPFWSLLSGHRAPGLSLRSPWTTLGNYGCALGVRTPSLRVGVVYLHPRVAVDAASSFFNDVAARLVLLSPQFSIVDGDFNARMGSAVSHDPVLDSAGRCLLRVREEYSLSACNSMSVNGQLLVTRSVVLRDGSRRSSTLDYAFVPEACEAAVQGVWVATNDDFPSDHSPLTVRFRSPVESVVLVPLVRSLLRP